MPKCAKNANHDRALHPWRPPRAGEPWWYSYAAMALQLDVEPLPLSRDPSGVIRIAGTRVSLESVVAVHEQGVSIPDLAEAFPDLTLADLHATIAYYLRHQEEVEVYIEDRRREAAAIEERLRRDFPEIHKRASKPEKRAERSSATNP